MSKTLLGPVRIQTSRNANAFSSAKVKLKMKWLAKLCIGTVASQGAISVGDSTNSSPLAFVRNHSANCRSSDLSTVLKCCSASQMDHLRKPDSETDKEKRSFAA